MPKIAWVIGLILPLGATSAEISKKTSDHIVSVIVADCNYCVSLEQIRTAARDWLLQTPDIAIGTVEWYESGLAFAEYEAIGKAETDSTFCSWKTVGHRERSHLWAQAIRLGERVGIRIKNKDGTVHSEMLSGDSLFEKLIEHQKLFLLDVRIRRRLQPESLPIKVHVLSPRLSDKNTASAFCQAYLSDLKVIASQVECVIGADDIRASDSRYPMNNPFHQIAHIPESESKLERTFSCYGRDYAECY